ncbi:F-box/LRR-repeat protein At3g03360-like isoform X2 [Silene latifolia]|uniref:F-box/LRR-repeat protein At3g03360-like isoform X2 n=2 Tax=Silene latifolia TaxID=37657 RepID=UPI003D77D882
MEERRWPTLNPCKQKRIKATVVHHNDRLSLLPYDILLKIWSHLTTKEAASASLVSRTLKHMWLVHPLLNFEEKKPYTFRLPSYFMKVRPFVDRVDHIVKHHLGPVIDEFRIDFALRNEYHSHVDNWLAFAFSKQVKRLEVVLKRDRYCDEWKRYDVKMPIEYQMSSNRFALTSLCLEFVHLTEQVIESFLNSFPSLEIFCIRCVHSFTSIRTCSPLLLKHLDVSNCERLHSIDLCVPHLLTFTCEAQPTALHFRNASSLSAMSIGSFLCSDFIGCTLDSLLIYCAQLECLELKSNLTAPCNLQIEQCPVFPNLKHLTLNVVADLDASILGWTPVIKACPVLQKLTLNLEARPPSECAPARRRYTVRKFDTHPLSSLKTLEIVGFLGHYVNLELVEFVIENADMLDELILDAMSPYVRKNSHKMFAYVPDVRSLDLESHKIALELLKKLPQSVKFVCR